jgi:hypothetical protein
VRPTPDVGALLATPGNGRAQKPKKCAQGPRSCRILDFLGRRRHRPSGRTGVRPYREWVNLNSEAEESSSCFRRRQRALRAILATIGAMADRLSSSSRNLIFQQSDRRNKIVAGLSPQSRAKHRGRRRARERSLNFGIWDKMHRAGLNANASTIGYRLLTIREALAAVRVEKIVDVGRNWVV